MVKFVLSNNNLVSNHSLSNWVAKTRLFRNCEVKVREIEITWELSGGVEVYDADFSESAGRGYLDLPFETIVS